MTHDIYKRVIDEQAQTIRDMRKVGLIGMVITFIGGFCVGLSICHL